MRKPQKKISKTEIRKWKEAFHKWDDSLDQQCRERMGLIGFLLAVNFIHKIEKQKINASILRSQNDKCLKDSIANSTFFKTLEK